MSSSLWREPLSGIIRQDAKVIGAISLPESDVQEFIDQFNHCYGPLRMRIEPPLFVPLANTSGPVCPVGANHRRPFRAPQPGFKPTAYNERQSDT